MLIGRPLHNQQLKQQYEYKPSPQLMSRKRDSLKDLALVPRPTYDRPPLPRKTPIQSTHKRPVTGRFSDVVLNDNHEQAH